MSLNNFRASGCILTKLPQTTWPEVWVLTHVQLLEGLPQKNLGGPKNVQIPAPFLTTLDFDREYLRNWSTYRTSEKNFINHYPFHVGRKRIGELWSTNKKVVVAHSDQPKWTFFRRQHFGHYEVLLSQFFTLVTDWPRLPSPSPNGDGGPPQKILMVKI